MTAFLVAALTALSVDFGEEVGKVRPELHSSGFGPQICGCPAERIADIKSMGFKAARTHDWALANPNQRVCDLHHMFPLLHADASDPKNYCFGPTDYLFKRTREELGHEIFFRFGTSIEHSGKTHFNAVIPEDFDKVAEVLAATIRHYNRGWANGYEWGIRDWEIWNEPDGINNMWCLPDGDEGWVVKTDEDKAKFKIRSEKYAELFVKCLKRVKAEFGDSVRVGGPALTEWLAIGGHDAVGFLRVTLDRCKAEGVAPDFVSWHHYTDDPDLIRDSIADARKLLDGYGFTACRLVINEWHYFGYGQYDWAELGSSDPERRKLAWEGPASHNGIDSAAFTLAVLSRFQTSALDQAFYYGCGLRGTWSYKGYDERKYKVFYALQMFGELMTGYTTICRGDEAREDKQAHSLVTAFAVKAEDGRKALLVSDYRTQAYKKLEVKVAGVSPDAKVTAEFLDFSHDRTPADFTFDDGVLTLKRPYTESSVFLVKFN